MGIGGIRMQDRFIFNAIVTGYYDIDTPNEYKEFEPQIYLEDVDVFSDEIGIDYDKLLDAVQKQLNLEKPEISQVMQHFEDNSNSSSEEYVTIKPDKILQCTGLKDKNGKLIYEGDIVVSTSPRRLSNRPHEVKLYKTSYGHYGYLYIEAEREPLVIGNIYENPELLEE